MQHFLLSRKARTLSLSRVARLSDEEAYETFRQVRWADTQGEPVCPRCGCLAVYTYATRKLYKCKGCNHQFSVTSGSIFASRVLVPFTLCSNRVAPFDLGRWSLLESES